MGDTDIGNMNLELQLTEEEGTTWYGMVKGEDIEVLVQN